MFVEQFGNPVELVMNEPKTLTKSGWSQSAIELVAIYLVTAVAATAFFELHWLIAMALAPALVLAALAVVCLLVQTLWMVVLGVERVGEACGMRKSPLS